VAVNINTRNANMKQPVMRTVDQLPMVVTRKLRMLMKDHLQREGRKNTWTQKESHSTPSKRYLACQFYSLNWNWWMICATKVW